MTDTIELLIPEATPSLNVTMRGHWTRQYRTRTHWHQLVRVARLEAKIYSPPNLAQARLTIERTGGRALDPDNFAGGAKFLIDGLRHEGFIAGDTLEHIGRPIFRQKIDPKLRQTIVKIERRLT